MMISKASRALVACNIYVSAGGQPNHRDLLLRLLGETQEHCRRANKNENKTSNKNQINNNNNNNPSKEEEEIMTMEQQVVVVHAFRDGPYDRSSFHLAGSPDLVADVGSSLAVRAVKALMRFETTNNNTDTNNALKVVTDNCDPRRLEEEEKGPPMGRRHPTVGLVDHVSVLPLEHEDNDNDKNKQDKTASITGSVARDIGETLISSFGVDVLYYGHAHPSGKELAAVRRESTRFFDDDDNKAAPNNNTISTVAAAAVAGQATVGAPDRFVENYNIRLWPKVSRKVARTLTEFVRERSGRGLPFVEALTLAYGSRDQYEVACNLLDPSVTSAKDIDERIRHWEQQQKQQQQQDDVSNDDDNDNDNLGLVETAYRVGTTTNMCLQALREVSTEKGEISHNQSVLKRLEEDFLVIQQQQQQQ